MLKFIALFSCLFAVCPVQSPAGESDQQAEKPHSKLTILTVLRRETNGPEVNDCIVYVDLSAKCMPRQKVERVKQSR